MEKGICTVSVAPIRANSSHQSEMTSQILFGETLQILERNGDFAKVKIDFDAYEGYLSVHQFSVITDAEISERNSEIISENFKMLNFQQGQILLSIGSEIEFEKPNVSDYLNSEPIIETAKRFLNVPYLWSGRSFFGIDCSGLVQLIYKIHGISLPREAHQQAERGVVLSFAEESKPGDLAFFENEEGQIIHVGMLLSPTEIIHAFGKVRIDALDSTGIYNQELKKHTHKLRFLRSII